MFTIAVGRGCESYENLALLFEKITPSLYSLKKGTFIHPSSSSFGIDMFFCSDGKFLLICLGLVAANGTFSCPFCALPNYDWSKSHRGKEGFEIEKFLRKVFFFFLEIKSKKSIISFSFSFYSFLFHVFLFFFHRGENKRFY